MNEKYNTFNKLAGKKDVMTSFFCYFGFHRWQKWSDIKNVNRPGYEIIKDTVQDRYCDHCNKYDRKVIKE